MAIPELPEVETIRRGLALELVGERIIKVEVCEPRVIYPNVVEFVRRLEGKVIEGIGRRGKYLIFCLSGGYLVVHLGMSGRLFISRDNMGDTKHVHAVFWLDGKRLCYVDVRKFGRLYAVEGLGEVVGLNNLGLEPLADEFSFGVLWEGVRRRKVKVKQLLLEQHFIAGIGNIYADEILYEAGIRPERRGSELSKEEVRRLHRAIKLVLQRAIRRRGTSLGDGMYVDAYGRLGGYEALVHGRGGGRCRRCGGLIERIRMGGRGTYFCGGCQG